MIVLVTNAEYIKNLFKKSFSEYVNNTIAIYGLSSNTQFILEGCPEYNIIGLLDGIKTNGEMYGKKIIDIKDCPSNNVDMIVIVARKGTTKIITKRIYDFCSTNNIALFDLYGNNLLSQSDLISEENSYFSFSFEDLLVQIDKHDIISFDMFDTLVMRKVLFPRDVFEYISENYNFDFDFITERIGTEQELYKCSNPTLEEIYDAISEKHGIEVSDIINAELETEKKMLISRNKMVEVLNYAVKKGKKVYIVSDMYLTSDKLRAILDNLNIKGYTDIIVSCEHGMTKTNGLFNVLKDITNNNSILHIGDNEEADGESAESCGIDSFLIKSAYDMMNISTLNEINSINYMSSYNARLCLGLFIAEVFNNPFALNNSFGRPMINSGNMLGKYIAPLITEFILWLDNSTKQDGCNTVLLAARDGSLIKKCCSYLEDGDRYIYFLTSRSAAVISSLKSIDDIETLLKVPYTGSPEDMLKNRYLLSEDDIDIYNDADTLSDYVGYHADKIISNSKRMRENYDLYISRCNIDLKKNIAFFDFVSSGTAQLNLQKIMGRKLYGYYFINVYDDNPEKRKLDIKAMGGNGLAFEIKNNLYDKYIFLENILTSEKPTLKEFDEFGNPVYFNEYRSGEQIQNIMDIHDSIVKYFMDFVSLKTDNSELCFDVVDGILGFIDGKKLRIDCEILESMVLKDDFNGTVFESNSMI